MQGDCVQTGAKSVSLIERAVRTLVLMGLPLLALAPAEAFADVQIRYKFQQGEVTNYIMTQSVTMNMKLQQQDISTRMNQQMYMQMTCDEVRPDGSGRMRLVINRLIMKSTNDGVPGGSNFEYDSASQEKPTGPLADILLKSLEPLVGAEWKQTISPLGQVSDIEVPEKVVESLKANPAAAMMGNMGTAAGLRQLSSQASMLFPAEPLTVGRTWDSQIEMKMPFGKMATKKTMKYLGPTDNQRERLSMETELSFQPDPASPVKLNVVDNDSEGEVLFDNQRGRLERSKLHQVTTMQVDAAGQKIDQVVTTDVLFEIDQNAKRTDAE